MPGHRRDNYKAKWLAALPEGVQLPAEHAASHVAKLNETSEASLNASIQLIKLQNVMEELAGATRNMTELMDECQETAGTDFGGMMHEIDKKLGSMDSILIARRARDVMRNAEARIGFLTAACDELMKENTILCSEISSTHALSGQFMKNVASTLFIGANPTLKEMETYVDKDRTGSFHRFDMHYSDMVQDFENTQLTARSSMHQKKDSGVSLTQDSNDLFESQKPRNRTAVIRPNRPSLNV